MRDRNMETSKTQSAPISAPEGRIAQLEQEKHDLLLALQEVKAPDGYCWELRVGPDWRGATSNAGTAEECGAAIAAIAKLHVRAPAANAGGQPVAIGWITTGDVEHTSEGAEIGDCDIEWDHKVIDALPEFAQPEATYGVYLNIAADRATATSAARHKFSHCLDCDHPVLCRKTNRCQNPETVRPASSAGGLSADDVTDFITTHKATWYPGYYGGKWHKDQKRGTLCYGDDRKEIEAATLKEAIASVRPAAKGAGGQNG